MKFYIRLCDWFNKDQGRFENTSNITMKFISCCCFRLNRGFLQLAFSCQILAESYTKNSAKVGVELPTPGTVYLAPVESDAYPSVLDHYCL